MSQPNKPIKIKRDKRHIRTAPQITSDFKTNGHQLPMRTKTIVRSHHDSGVGVEIPAIDVDKFLLSNFEAEAYINETLLSVNEESLRGFYRSLQEAKELSSHNLKDNVYQNYNEFVVISKEISQLESDMLTLKDRLADIRSTTDMLIEGNGADGKDNGSSDKSYIGNDNADVWKTQTAAIWRNVDGAEKLLPHHPSRTLVLECPGIKELQAGTLRHKQNVNLYLCSDVLLIAAQKEGVQASKTRLVAQTCWKLSEIAVTDIRDVSKLKNAFKVIRPPESFIFCSDTPDMKRDFLKKLKRTVEELKIEMAREVSVSPKKSLGASVPTKRELSKAEMKRIADVSDELDVHIAQREFEAAVHCSEEARKILRLCTAEGTQMKAVNKRIEDRVANLVSVISHDMMNPMLTKSQNCANVSWLLRLGYPDKAKEAFLGGRSSTIRHRTRQIQLEGDVTRYIKELFLVVFTLIRNTCEWFMASFRDASMSSALVKWVKEEIEKYAEIFRKQMFHHEQPMQVIADGLNYASEQCKKLREVGVDLSFLIDKIFLPNLVETISNHEKRYLDGFNRELSKDTFELVSLDVISQDPYSLLDKDSRLTTSSFYFYKSVFSFVKEIAVISNPTLYPKVIGSIVALFEGYLKNLMIHCKSSSLSDQQSFGIVADASFILESVLPSVAAYLSELYHGSISELQGLKSRMSGYQSTLTDIYCLRRCHSLVESTYRFADIDYSQSEDIGEDAVPCDQIIKLILDMHDISLEAAQWPLNRSLFIAGIIEQFFRTMNDAPCWEGDDHQPRAFGYGGVHQLVLDIHFFLKVTDEFITQSTTKAANAICERALRMYFAQNPASKLPLKTAQWYDERVAHLMKELGSEFSQFGTQ
ncbi:hypothetical protein K493DRAFT_315777 [Basidiobolus meristosporus CBS 931.73]|uniref:Exocyst complex component EXO84 n=1 Tax=Basidiobolus meristosporus CBS 931.73 TaxID=1314790 RepID=A0A1Y1Y779_9FUNG|nr:hypothetical protein K493DRAFT_315777 [Basidiobolus meristosporus CBS 931.73]|eukprot:ORX93838.1 hypothetical protein K493DRAFT_315777 [Basidiobolus meristosporus CBS 931.73]